MNFGNALSLRVEEIMDELRPAEPKDDPDAMAEWQWSEEDEKEIYDEALAQALEESEGIAWAAGNIRIGELILIIDSDTRVPEDCFLDAASYVPILASTYKQRILQFAQHCHHSARVRRHASRRPLFRKRHHLVHHPYQFCHFLLRCQW
jgi:hypothetical protein